MLLVVHKTNNYVKLLKLKIMIEAQLKELEECMRVHCIDRDDLLAYLLKEKGLTIKAVKQAKSLSKSPWRTLEPDEALEYLLKKEGLTRTDLEGVKASKKSEKKESKSCKVKEAKKPSVSTNWKDYPIVNPKFGDNDIRSRVKIGWYAFAGGNFSPDKDAFPDCQGVIGIINDDPKAKEGNRVKVVLRHQKELQWCEEHIYTGVTDDDNGKENTRRLLEFGKAHGIKFPAMEFAQDYNYDGVKAGEAYVPAKKELIELSKNYEVINKALEQIGSTFNDYYWSSFEDSSHYVRSMTPSDGYVFYGGKFNSYAVSCLLTY